VSGGSGGDSKRFFFATLGVSGSPCNPAVVVVVVVVVAGSALTSAQSVTLCTVTPTTTIISAITIANHQRLHP